MSAAVSEAGNGRWNLGRYVIASGSDLPLDDIEILPPVAANECMTEIVIMPVVPGQLNG
jgi:hypothetical protein